MTDIPIIFSAAMVRALLDGRKTMTRRIAYKAGGPQGDPKYYRGKPTPWFKVKAGDRMFVRENFSGPWDLRNMPPREWAWHDMSIWYWADGNPEDGDWTKPRPSIYMPRWASRITLIVTGTKLEQLQAITEDDARAEGARADHGVHRIGFRILWSELHGPESWHASPWVMAISFKVILANIDSAEAKAA